MKYLLILCLLVFPATVAASKKKEKAAAPSSAARTEEDEATKAAAEFEAGLKYERGKIVLPGGMATLNVPDNFRYLSPEQTDRIIVDAWGNPPGTKTLGMLFPSDVSPLSPEGWGVVITFEEDGYVEDDEAGKINYDELLTQMKEATAERNKEREQQGFEPVNLVGWATRPRYDQATRKLYWAKELNFAGAPVNTLNYDIRVLGRRGVLSFNAVASMDQLGAIEQNMKEVLGFAEFNPGHRYADFSSGTDKVAAYGIGALIAGKVAAKVGLFKLALGFILAGKKFLFLGLLAVAAFVKKLFGRKSE
ncbi:MAG TPA: DUF2167 domain-containing protein [Pyrinomonadaceae bacterium]